MPAYFCSAGNAGNKDFSFLDSRLRGNASLQPAAVRSLPAAPAGATASCFIRLKCYKPGNFVSLGFAKINNGKTLMIRNI